MKWTKTNVPDRILIVDILDHDSTKHENCMCVLYMCLMRKSNFPCDKNIWCQQES